VGAARHVERVEFLGLDARQFGGKGLHDPLVAHEFVGGESAEDLEDRWCAGCSALSVLGIGRDRRDAVGGDGALVLALDGGLNEDRYEVAAQQLVDARDVFEEDGSDEPNSLELGVTSLEVRLVFVGGEGVSVAERGVVRNEWEASVGLGVVGDESGVGLSGEREGGAGGLAVAGLPVRPSPALLIEGFPLPLVHLDAHPARAVR